MPQPVSADVVFPAFERPNNAAELFLHQLLAERRRQGRAVEHSTKNPGQTGPGTKSYWG
jgi:hypothetical protein